MTAHLVLVVAKSNLAPPPCGRHQGFFRREYTPTARGFGRFIGFYTGGESHRTHVTSYGIYNCGYTNHSNNPGCIPWWWTPADNRTIPTRGCSALWDLHNDSAVAPVSAAAAAVPAAAVPASCGARVLHDTGCATASYNTTKAGGWSDCCSLCAAEGAGQCKNWVFAKGLCHLRHTCSSGTHVAKGVVCGIFPGGLPPPPPPLPPRNFGGFAKVMNGTYSNEIYASGFEGFIDEHLAASTASGATSPLPFFAVRGCTSSLRPTPLRCALGCHTYCGLAHTRERARLRAHACSTWRFTTSTYHSRLNQST